MWAHRPWGKLGRLATREATRVPNLLYEISSIVLLVAIRTCAELLKSAKILWPEL